MADFLRQNGWTYLSRLDNGMVMCCICMEYRWPKDLYVDDAGDRWDFCKGQCTYEAGVKE